MAPASRGLNSGSGQHSVSNVKEYFQGSTLAGIIAGLLATGSWSALNVIIKYKIGTDLHPALISSGMFLSALTTLAPLSVLFWKRRDGPYRLPKPPLVSSLARTGAVLALVYAVRTLSATQTTIYTRLSPIWVLAILFFTNRDRVNPGSLAGSVLAFTGVYVIAGGFGGAQGVGWGSVAAIASGFLQAVFTVTLKRASVRVPATGLEGKLRFVLSLMGVCFLLTVPFALLVFPGQMPDASILLWIWMGGAMFNAFAYLLYYWCLTLVPEILAVVIVSLTIPFTLLIEKAFYGIETPPALLLGALLVVCGILLVARGK
jgi:drug/metabolite transporter (DMT)-like permease